jgi:tellurite resistance protein TehA-like permease
MNAMGWSVVILHLVFLLWFGYYIINQGKMDSSR